MKKIALSLITGASLLLTTGCNCQKTNNTTKAQTNNPEIKITTPNANSKETKTMDTIKRSASGLGYEVLKPGTGAKPKAGQTVTVHYTGYLDDNGKPGKKFDSSVDRGTPFSTAIGVGRVIAGWDEGLQNMQVGEKCRLFIPANLGYGARGAGAAIPPNANLIFDVELLAVK